MHDVLAALERMPNQSKTVGVNTSYLTSWAGMAAGGCNRPLRLR